MSETALNRFPAILTELTGSSPPSPILILRLILIHHIIRNRIMAVLKALDSLREPAH